MQSVICVLGTSEKKGKLDNTSKKKFQSVQENDQVTPQEAIDSLKKYTVRRNGAYSASNCICDICQRNFGTGDRVVCLPCQHTFHEYCIENWLRWVKSCCPIDKKSILKDHYWIETENERCKSKGNKNSKVDIAAERRNQVSSENKMLPADSNSRALGSHRKTLNTVEKKYPISSMTCIPLLQRFSHLMNVEGSESRCASFQSSSSQESLAKKSQGLQSTRNSKLISLEKRHKSYTGVTGKYDHGGNQSPNNSNTNYPFKWLPRPTVPDEKNSRKSGIHGNLNENNKTTAQTVVIRKSVTFADALREPVVNNGGWVYKTRTNSPI